MDNVSTFCRVKDCNQPVIAKHLCNVHYRRMLAHGDVRGRRPPQPLTDIPGEEWRPVVGYEGVYEVSDHGRVRRIKPAKGIKRFGQPLVPHRIRHYLAVQLRDTTRATHAHVHTLVAAAFLDPPPGRIGKHRGNYQVNHKDGDKDNNCAWNLEYLTHAENNGHASANGLLRRGVDRPNAKLTDDDVRAIRAAAGTVSQTQLARKYGVSSGIICQIIQRRRWTHVD